MPPALRLKLMSQPLFDTEKFHTPTTEISFFIDPNIQRIREKFKPGRAQELIWRYRRKLARRQRTQWRAEWEMPT